MNNKKLFFMPKYIDNFTCIGHDCEDSCCSGWNIPIDEDTYKKYINTTDEKFKKLLDKKIVKNDKEPSFLSYGLMVLKKGMKCSFLNENGLCDIHGNFGEKNLCITCTNFPRIINIVDDVYEKSILLSCPEAARQVLLNPEKVEFIESEQEIDEEKVEIRRIMQTDEFYEIENLLQYFWDIRVFTINILQDRNYTLDERLCILHLFYYEIQKYIDNDEFDDILNFIENFKDNLESLKLENNFNKFYKIDLIKKLWKDTFCRLDNNNRLLSCIYEFEKGLGLTENLSDEKILKNYEEAYQRYYIPYMRNREYILENYLVNYFFKELCPFTGDENLFCGFIKMVKHYVVVRTYLIGISAYNKDNFNEKNIVKLIQSLSKTMEHTRRYKDILEFEI